MAAYYGLRRRLRRLRRRLRRLRRRRLRRLVVYFVVVNARPLSIAARSCPSTTLRVRTRKKSSEANWEEETGGGR